ncbi:Uncharacterised protein [Mycobacteroides abscessus subsp. abscessus]|nr:Uncharacterised protein [Mycobacteroides abscessus subsp. abscessus]
MARNRLAAGCRASAGKFAADRMRSRVATTGTSANGPGNSRTPLMSAPHDRIATTATKLSSWRSHIGHRVPATNAPTSTPSSNSQARAKVL